MLRLWVFASLVACCAAGYMETFGDYSYSTYPDEKLSWMEAYKQCKDDDAELIWIDSRNEVNFLEGFVKRAGTITGLWTSGADPFVTGKYVWMANAGQIDPSFWGKGEPTKGIEHCVCYGNQYLNDYTCDSKLNYVCKWKN